MHKSHTFRFFSPTEVYLSLIHRIDREPQDLLIDPPRVSVCVISYRPTSSSLKRCKDLSHSDLIFPTTDLHCHIESLHKPPHHFLQPWKAPSISTSPRPPRALCMVINGDANLAHYGWQNENFWFNVFDMIPQVIGTTVPPFSSDREIKRDPIGPLLSVDQPLRRLTTATTFVPAVLLGVSVTPLWFIPVFQKIS